MIVLNATFPYSILLFSHGRVLKYCDFGTAKKLENTLSNTNAVGTIRYMAPEVIRGQSRLSHLPKASNDLLFFSQINAETFLTELW